MSFSQVRAAASADALDLFVAGRANDRLGDGGAVDHLIERDRIALTARGRLGESVQRGGRHVDRLRLPYLRLALDRLELAGAEERRAALFRRRTGHVGDAFKPQPALGAETLAAEAGPGRGQGDE